MDRILITGCCGTTGTALVKYLLDNTDSEIYGVDNFYKEGSRENYKELNRYAESKGKWWKFKELDISKEEFYEWLNQGRENSFSSNLPIKFNKVYNLAAIVETPRFYDSPYQTHEVNCNSAIKLYQWCNQTGVEKFVNASSSEIYGHATEFPTKETTPQHYDAVEVSPRWSYAHGKILTEYVMNQIYNEAFKVMKSPCKVCHLRYANVYGENDINPVHVIPQFLYHIFMDLDLHVNAEPTKFMRAFLHNDDSTLGTYLAMENMISTHAYNIGSAEEVTIAELLRKCLEKVRELTKKEYKGVVHYDLVRAGDPVRRRLDTTRAKEELGFECKVSLDEGIDRTARAMYKELTESGDL